jgi:phosphohistidine phosphatase SixA
VAVLVLIRHADAGDREAWDDDDSRRPLSAKGRRQAEALAADLARTRLERVLASPADRCLQTVEPLAQARKLEIEQSEALAEGAPLADTLALIRELAGTQAALCTHGDVVENVVDWLRERGIVDDNRRPLRKAGVWLLGESAGEVTSARRLPPPKV